MKLDIPRFLGVPSTIDVSLIMRGLFAYAVLYWHVHGYKQELPNFLNVPGRVSVWLFFGISGYVIASGFLGGHHTYTRRGILRYTLRRLARIFPLFWMLSFIVFFLDLPLAASLSSDWVERLQQLFALKFVHTGYPVGVFWTLGIEIQFYLTAPLLCLIVIRSRYWPSWLQAVYLGFFRNKQQTFRCQLSVGASRRFRQAS